MSYPPEHAVLGGLALKAGLSLGSTVGSRMECLPQLLDAYYGDRDDGPGDPDGMVGPSLKDANWRGGMRRPTC